MRKGKVILLVVLAFACALAMARGAEGETRLAKKSGEVRPAPARGKLQTLDESFFSTVTFTNEIQAEWLKPPTNFFRIGPGDYVEIENLGQPGARSMTLVGPDGRIYYNLLPGLPVWGLTLNETRDLLEKEMNRFTRVKPELAITLRGVGSRRVWLLGSVQAPGVLPMATPMTLLEAIALAGGVTPVAGSSSGLPDLQRSFLMRRGQVLRPDFHRLISAGDLSQNIYLEPDDFVYLRSSVSRNVYVMGAVATPNIVPYSDRMTLLSAIAASGGTVPYARVAHVAVVRGSLASPRLAVLDYQSIATGKTADVRLEPGDIVYVPFVAYRKLAELADNILKTLVTTTAANEGARAVNANAQPIGVSVSPSSVGTAP